MQKLIITSAICGAEVTKKQNPAVPYTIREIADEAYRAYNAGASIIHLHVREDDGTPTQSKDRYAEAIDAIKNKCKDIIIQPSTGGAVGMSAEERCEVLQLNPLMASLDCGTLNFGGDEIFVNTESMIIDFAKKMKERGIKPECEVFDKSMIDTALRLNKKGIIDSPLHFNFVLGVNGGISGTLRDLLFLKESIPNTSTFTVSGIGKCQTEVTLGSILLGGHVRVGLEDSIYLSKGVLLDSNAQIVEKIVRLSKEIGRDIADVKESREILGV